MVARDGQTPTSLLRSLACEPGMAGRQAWYPWRADTPARVTLLGSTRLPVVKTVFGSVFQPWSQETGRAHVPSEASARRHGHGRQARALSTESRRASPGNATKIDAFACREHRVFLGVSTMVARDGQSPRPFGGLCQATRARQAGTRVIHREPTRQPG